MMSSLHRLVNGGSFKAIWSAIAVIAVGCSLIASHATPLVALSTFLGIIYVLGVSYKWIHANLFGAGMALGFAVLSYQVGFYGNTAVNALVLFPLSLYGWYVWRFRSKGKSVGSSDLRRTLTRSEAIPIISIGIFAFSIAVAFSLHSGAFLPYYDAFTTVMPVIATIMLVSAYREQWYAWIPYNFIEILMWFAAASVAPEVLAILVMRIIFFINSLIGAVIWFGDTETDYEHFRDS